MENKNNDPKEAFKITGNWDNQSQQLKQKYTQLTDSDLKFEEGKEEELIQRVESRLNKKRDEVINIIKTEESASQN